VGWGRGDTVSGERTRGLERRRVIPGQGVFADSSGAVMIPPGDLERAPAEARSIKADDARYREEIAREDRPAP
jgi:regulator of RNase E activity RraA